MKVTFQERLRKMMRVKTSDVQVTIGSYDAKNSPANQMLFLALYVSINVVEITR